MINKSNIISVKRYFLCNMENKAVFLFFLENLAGIYIDNKTEYR